MSLTENEIVVPTGPIVDNKQTMITLAGAVAKLNEILLRGGVEDAGLNIPNELSIGSYYKGSELVVGYGDSTTETMLCYHTTDDVNFTDVTEIFVTDTGSATGLFGGVTSGHKLYVGADFEFTGLKAKISADGSFLPEEVETTFTSNLGVKDVKYMATDSAVNPYGPMQYGDRLAQNGLPSEQWRFNFDPYAELGQWQKTIVNGVEKYWGMFEIISDIQLDPILEQLKLHTTRFEVNANGIIEFFGVSRYKKHITSGIRSMIPNATKNPGNSNINYAPGIVGVGVDNKFVKSVDDGFLYPFTIPVGLDTSIKLHVEVSYLPKDNADGDVVFNVDAVHYNEGDKLDGTLAVKGQSKTIPLLGVDIDVLHKVSFLADVSGLVPGDKILLSVYRNGTNVLDTYNGNVIVEDIDIDGYFWTM